MSANASYFCYLTMHSLRLLQKIIPPLKYLFTVSHIQLKATTLLIYIYIGMNTNYYINKVKPSSKP